MFSLCGKLLWSRRVKGGYKQGRDINRCWYCLVWFKSTDHSHEDTAKNTTTCPAPVDGSLKMIELRLFKVHALTDELLRVIKWKHHHIKNQLGQVFFFCLNWSKILCCWIRVSWKVVKESLLSNPKWSAWENSLVHSWNLVKICCKIKKKKTSTHSPAVLELWSYHFSLDVGWSVLFRLKYFDNYLNH